ncbi:isoprenylcysteine carboxylmethyltransferase family protein [Ramlibacter monticola]|uniref:Isoprenylcysteine carboxylmethyltransferase family protein n=1 Tax=Ramlibacter monticola TaxID=1926872 RepID=A0A937CXW7_9BURK|nr:isoprenylcysteine carboxylmethyltransferase family protein [Ramlibacter monticola]MBL0395209.1 isoprenylcysteine carboxylmethyltransferase family protein [Ramlibacter monticola]
MLNLEHRIPPPVVGLAIAAAMWAVGQMPPAFALASWVRDALVVVLVAAGLAFDLAGLVAFRRLRTTVNPLRPQNASALVTGGVYRVTRNPMYVGMALLLTAWAVQLSSAWPFFGPLAFVLFIDRFQVVPEEKAMRERFGESWAAYAARVRRWL